MRHSNRLKAVPVPDSNVREENSILKNNFKYISADKTDIAVTFRKYGFVPPSEYRDDYLFKTNRMEKGV